MKDDFTNRPVRDGYEEVARATAEMRAFRGDDTYAAAAAKIGASGPQWWGWERCAHEERPRPAAAYRDKLHVVAGIAPWKWRTREEQEEINNLRAGVDADREKADSSGDAEAP